MEDKPQVAKESETEVTMSTHPRDWPTFKVGETIVWKGITFKIQRVNKSNIVLRPGVEGMPASQVMWLMSGNG